MDILSAPLRLSHCSGPQTWGVAYWMRGGGAGRGGSVTGGEVVVGEKCLANGRCSPDDVNVC